MNKAEKTSGSATETSRDLPALRHTDLVVSSLPTSLHFYRKLLSILGWQEEVTIKGERGETLIYLAGPHGFNAGALGFREQQTPKNIKPYDRYNLGVHHLAINAKSRAEVRKCARWLKANSHKIESGPAQYYNNDYYAVYFYDPDGIKLEIVCAK